MSALSKAKEELGDPIAAAMEYMCDSMCPAYCAECGEIGEFEHDFRGPCPSCGNMDCGSLMDLLGVI